MDKPAFITRNGMISDSEYVTWLNELKLRYRSGQVKAALEVNQTMLEFYWSLGRDIVTLKAESKWGSNFFEQLSLDMKRVFPGEKGFSSANLRYMKRWYLYHCEHIVNLQQPAEKIHQHTGSSLTNIEGCLMPSLFGRIPWFHHITIFTKSKSYEEATFYIKKTAENNWSRAILERNIASDLYHHQGIALTNFSDTLPTPHNSLAQEVLKDEYNLDFLGSSEVHRERDLENELAKNITQFLLELGQGFAYVGRQKELKMPGGQVFFPDLIFYHIYLRCYVVVELKAVEFSPEHVGKINFYISAADELLKRNDDKPTIGLVICKSMDRTIVEWAFRGIDRPLGVATYQLQEVVKRTVAEIEVRQQSK